MMADPQELRSICNTEVEPSSTTTNSYSFRVWAFSERNRDVGNRLGQMKHLVPGEGRLVDDLSHIALNGSRPPCQ